MSLIRILLCTSALMLCTWGAGAQMSDSEKRLADLIECKQFKKNADGSWIGAPHAKIGKIMGGGQIFVRGGFKLDGADIATVLDRMCDRKF